jgi:hypothetical protein
MTTMGEEHVGGMVALIPRADDAEKLRVPGGEKPDQLHLTLAYLGDDVTDWPATQRNALTATALEVARMHGEPVVARAMGHAVFNPDGHDDRTPCAVYLIGDTELITPMRNRMRDAVLQPQHEPFIPHVTAGYGLKPGRLKYTGPVVFDRLRVAFAGDTYDFPLGEVGEKSIADDFLVTTIDAGLLYEGKIVIPAEGLSEEMVELKLMSPDPRAARLREYWAHGKGRAQWNKWRELRRKLRKYVKNPNILDGLTSNIYRLAKGHNPPRGAKSALDGFELNEIEIKAALALADPDADLDLEALADWMDDDDTGDEEFDENDPDQVYEQALINDIDWEIDSEGALVRDDDEDMVEEDDEEIPVGPRQVDTVSLWDLADND